jgi:hypothetical protein
MVALMFLEYSVGVSLENLVLPSGPVAGAVPEANTCSTERIRTWRRPRGAVRLRRFRRAGPVDASTRAGAVAASAVFVPLAIVIALYYRIYQFEQSLPFAGFSARARGAICGRYGNVEPPRTARQRGGGSHFATGAVAALALALTLALEKGWLTVALALMVRASPGSPTSVRCRRCAF